MKGSIVTGWEKERSKYGILLIYDFVLYVKFRLKQKQIKVKDMLM